MLPCSSADIITPDIIYISACLFHARLMIDVRLFFHSSFLSLAIAHISPDIPSARTYFA